MKYIDAEKLIALLEQRKKQLAKWTDKEYANQRIDEIDCILDVDINSLQQEQQEADLDEEMDRFFEEMSIQEHENIFEDTYQMIARHFYKLGLNAKEDKQ